MPVRDKKVRIPYKPFEYQKFCYEHILANKGAGCFLDMGLGKTSIVLDAIDTIIYNFFELSKVLIVAPKKVALSTWPNELRKWENFKHLKFSIVVGTEAERITALRVKADIYITNRDTIIWLVSYYASKWPFPMVVLDESTSFKNYDSKRFKALKTKLPLIERLVILSGSPTPRTLIDLWAQVYLLDRGERLGTTIGAYRDKYFNEGKKKGYVVYDWQLKEDKSRFIGEDYYEKLIHDKISDICISMKSEDLQELPERIDRFIPIELPARVRKKYDEFEEELVLSLDDFEGDFEDIVAANAAVLSGKLLQFTAGAIYTEKPEYYEVHNEKIEALDEIVENCEGKNVLCFYNFASDLERIRAKLKHYKPRQLKTEKDIDDWNDGKIRLALVQPQSGAWGLNLQDGGSIIVWYGLPWNLELYQQGNKRLHRTGQLMKCIIHHLFCPGTVDDDVIASLDVKAGRQNRLLEALKVRLIKHKK